METHIRKATIEDLEVLVSFQTLMAMETEKLQLDNETLKKGVRALFEDSSKGVYYVICESGKVIGCLLTTPEWSEWRNGTVLWIQSLYVKSEFRNRGLFKKMYTFLQEMVAADESLKGIRLYVDISNKAAQQVYQKLGMNGQHYQLFEWMKK